MSIPLLKIIDEYLGRIIVFFLSIFKRPFSPKSQQNKQGKNILFIKFWGTGSIVLATPAIHRVKIAYPDSKIFFLTLQNNLEICNEIKLIDDTLTINISNPFSFISDLIKTIFFLRKVNFDIIFDFEFYTYFSAIMVAMIKSNVSIGFDNLKNNRKILFSKTIIFNDRMHTKVNFLNLVNAESNINSFTETKSLFPELRIFSHNKNGELKIIVNPNASKLAYERRLPKESFIAIINHITKNFKYKILLTGCEDEKNYVNDIYKYLKEKLLIENLCGKTNIKELISIINSSECLITNDSGPLHIASALNKPTIAFFGPESPVRYGPLGESNLVFYKNLQCSPCMSISNSKTVNCIYDSPKCMEQFELDDVIKKIDSFLNEIILSKEYKDSVWSESI